MLLVGGIDDTLYSVMKVSHMFLLSGEHELLLFSNSSKDHLKTYCFHDAEGNLAN